MIATIKSLIPDSQEALPETGVPRHLGIEPVHGKAAVCIGVRRSGKSTYLFQATLFRDLVQRHDISHPRAVTDLSLARSNARPKKVCCIDHALIASVSSGILVKSGHLLDNLEFTALRRLHPAINYTKTRNGREVDFIVPRGGGAPRLVQACESLADPHTRKREIAALGEAMAELGLSNGTTVTRNEDERIEAAGANIDAVPAWRYPLELPDVAE